MHAPWTVYSFVVPCLPVSHCIKKLNQLKERSNAQRKTYHHRDMKYILCRLCLTSSCLFFLYTIYNICKFLLKLYTRIYLQRRRSLQVNSLHCRLWWWLRLLNLICVVRRNTFAFIALCELCWFYVYASLAVY